jgi:hypothetical protein
VLRPKGTVLHHVKRGCHLNALACCDPVRDPGCQKSLPLAVAEEGPGLPLRTCQLGVGRDGCKPSLSLPPRSRTACLHS